MRKKLRSIYTGSVGKKKKRVHYKKRLKSGKTAHLWLYKQKFIDSPSFGWSVGLRVSDTDKEARLWLMGNNNGESGITGDGSIEALAWALRKIEEFSTLIPETETVVVGWEDDRRKSAYRYLRKKGWYLDEWAGCYYKRGGNPSGFKLSPKPFSGTMSQFETAS